MKRLSVIFFAFLVSVALGEEPQGIKADVELLSGTRQRAQFLGIENDTVKLGGYIKNEFTVVRIAKGQFKSITDAEGRDLLHPEVAMQTSDSVAQDSSKVTVHATDSLEGAPQKRTINSKSILVSFEGSINDSSLLESLDDVVSRMLHEAGFAVERVKRNELDDCDDDICVQQKLSKMGAREIFLGRVEESSHDSLVLELSQAVFEDELPTLYKSKVTVSQKTALGDLLKDGKLNRLLLEARGESVPAPQNVKSFIFVETDPEGATLSRSGDSDICKTPCAFAVGDTGKLTLNAYWNVGEHLWGAQTTIFPIPGDTAKISLKLKPVRPEVQVITTPAGAEIFKGDEEISKRSRSLGKTPAKLYTNEPGMTSLKIRQIGFRDTVIQFYVAPVSETKLNVQMEHLTEYEDLLEQQRWKHDRNMLTLGKVLMSCAVAPVVVGAIFAYLGHKDYEDADDIKDDLQVPGSVHGEEYQKLVKKNRQLVDDGDKKMIIGASLAGSGVVLLGLGLFFAF